MRKDSIFFSLIKTSAKKIHPNLLVKQEEWEYVDRSPKGVCEWKADWICRGSGGCKEQEGRRRPTVLLTSRIVGSSHLIKWIFLTVILHSKVLLDSLLLFWCFWGWFGVFFWGVLKAGILSFLWVNVFAWLELKRCSLVSFMWSVVILFSASSHSGWAENVLFCWKKKS